MTTTPAGSAPRGLTHRDLDDAPDDGNRWEVIDGTLHVSPFPTSKHQKAATRLTTLLDGYVSERGLGHVFGAGFKVVLDEPTGVGPDLVFISNARLAALREDGYYGAPDLIVEVLPTKPALDRMVKRDKYAQAGVPHYWIVDPGKRTFEAYRLDGDRYALPLELPGDAVYEPEWLPGLQVRVRELWL